MLLVNVFFLLKLLSIFIKTGGKMFTRFMFSFKFSSDSQLYNSFNVAVVLMSGGIFVFQTVDLKTKPVATIKTVKMQNKRALILLLILIYHNCFCVSCIFIHL